jgi:Arc/MetJ-type ribon-helix-helix transcriptional regulator
MTISLPNELENSLRAEVLSGHFASEDDAVTEILRDYFRRKAAESVSTAGIPAANGGLGSIGSMRDAAAELDEIVTDAYRRRGLTEDEFKRQLLEAGLMTSLPIRLDSATEQVFQPITIDGEPISETIIRERR